MVFLFLDGCKAPAIAKLLNSEGVSASRRGVDNFFKGYIERRTVARRPESGRPFKVTDGQSEEHGRGENEGRRRDYRDTAAPGSR